MTPIHAQPIWQDLSTSSGLQVANAQFDALDDASSITGATEANALYGADQFAIVSHESTGWARI